eukprot:TRINITY_DN7966_c0_g1_i3.p1 TRINITY_DN7966_c0_g1~~TRINITY_DN7966_c0_g1_i3.p1  ORF type:complete len:373 (+),score=72.37 TRINITY_DN7966_c0_g1_i3:88-1206(+)
MDSEKESLLRSSQLHEESDEDVEMYSKNHCERAQELHVYRKENKDHDSEERHGLLHDHISNVGPHNIVDAESWDSVYWWNRPPLWRNLALIEMIRCIRMALFGLPVLVLMWKQDYGLSSKQILGLQTIQSTITIVMEIPSGYISDHMGRRRTLMMSAASNFAAYFIYSTASSFNVLIFAQVMQAIGNSLWSGTDVSIQYETIKQIGGPDRSVALGRESRNLSNRQLTECIAAIIGGYIAIYFGKQTAIFLTALSFVVVLIGSALLVEPKAEIVDDKDPIYERLRLLMSERSFLRPVLVGSFMSASSYLNVWMQPLLWQQNGVAESYYGWYVAHFHVIPQTETNFSTNILLSDDLFTSIFFQSHFFIRKHLKA